MAPFRRHKRVLIFFLAPQLVVTLVFFFLPALSALWQSFQFGDAFGLHRRWAGLCNYIDLFQDPSYFQAVVVTLGLAIAITTSCIILGVLMANLLLAITGGRNIYKTMLIWPYAVAPAVAAILWRFLFQPKLGWVAQTAQWFGMEFNYLTHPLQAMATIIITASWQQFSYNFLFFFAALSAIPKEIIEAASLDGVSSWRLFWQIKLPLISPTTFFLLVMNLIYAFFDTFGIIDVMTHGGPAQYTTTLIYKVYQDGFVAFDPTSSATQSVILMIVVSLMIWFQFRYVEKKVHYQ
ncbi:ABC transporter permease subunit [Legionella sp. W05-934-2]|jgi:sn-glycerol 3-phosphate transport system permease protein|uniref:ABC transporter permease subunit n=1 Tax=Legionella sp. W05-934-2 TaxID=1198649 RepID=UPI003461A79D